MSPVTGKYSPATTICGFIAVMSMALPLGAAPTAQGEDFDLTSDQLVEAQAASEPVVYGNTLDTMRASEKPRFVTLIDAFQYVRGNGLGSRGVLFSYHNRAA